MARIKAKKPLEKCHDKNCGDLVSETKLGLCIKCHAGLARLVSEGETTWEAIFAAGLAIPPHDRGKSKTPSIRSAAEAGLIPSVIVQPQ